MLQSWKNLYLPGYFYYFLKYNKITKEKEEVVSVASFGLDFFSQYKIYSGIFIDGLCMFWETQIRNDHI